MNAGGGVSTASITVVLDTAPPTVHIDSPANGATVTSPEILVAGLVNDVVTGTVNSEQVSVVVNGIKADVGNRSFMASGVLLVPGQNIITAVAKDRAGNTSQSQVTVTLRDVANQQRILVVSGNNQSAPVGTTRMRCWLATSRNVTNQQRILVVSGNNQSAPVGTTLPQPLTVQLVSALDQTLSNVPVTFTIIKSDGQLSSFPQQGRQVSIQTDDNGQA